MPTFGAQLMLYEMLYCHKMMYFCNDEDCEYFFYFSCGEPCEVVYEAEKQMNVVIIKNSLSDRIFGKQYLMKILC
jgi:hypothetical protein